MNQESINNDQLTEFDSILAESIINSKLKEGTIIKGIIAEIEDEAVIVDIGAAKGHSQPIKVHTKNPKTKPDKTSAA